MFLIFVAACLGITRPASKTRSTFPVATTTPQAAHHQVPERLGGLPATEYVRRVISRHFRAGVYLLPVATVLIHLLGFLVGWPIILFLISPSACVIWDVIIFA